MDSLAGDDAQSARGDSTGSWPTGFLRLLLGPQSARNDTLFRTDAVTAMFNRVTVIKKRGVARY